MDHPLQPPDLGLRDSFQNATNTESATTESVRGFLRDIYIKYRALLKPVLILTIGSSPLFP